MRALAGQPLLSTPILLFHSVGDDTSGPLGRYTLSVRHFRDQMLWIADMGYTTLTATEYSSVLARQQLPPEHALVITFDDGLADFVENALPVLSSFGHACTMYVNTAAMWKTRRRALGGRPTLSWREVSALPAGGVEVGGHGHEHLQLDLLPSSRVESELRVCKDQLEQATQAEVTSFAYPHGYNRAVTRRLVREAGFSSACAVRNQISHQGDNRWALARVMLTAGRSAAFLERAIGQSMLPAARKPAGLRTMLWRAARLARTRGRPLVHVTDA
jgi:peptidoglycan/xylan/chitin deacetylase (PgdA/CDA1 family)